MKSVIVHDWLVVYGGAERVLEQMLKIYPEADLYSLVDFVPADQRWFLQGKYVNTSFIQKLPFVRYKYRHYLPVMPFAVEQFDLSAYDLVISSSHAVAKGVLTGPDQLHICMCYSPVRYAWDMHHQYLQETGLNRGLKSWYARKILHDLRLWDYRTANGVNEFIAISKHIEQRIWKVYRRNSKIIYPPVDVNFFVPGNKKNDYYLAISRLVPYKKIDLIVEAFTQMPDKKLVVIGEGPEMRKIKRKAGKNVELLGYQPFREVLRHMQRAKALVFAALDDFGIVLVEAQACGTPVIAYGRGGTLDAIRGLGEEKPTGVFFHRQDVSALVEAVNLFERKKNNFSTENCRENAMRFSQERFQNELKGFIEDAWKKFCTRSHEAF